MGKLAGKSLIVTGAARGDRRRDRTGMHRGGSAGRRHRPRPADRGCRRGDRRLGRCRRPHRRGPRGAGRRGHRRAARAAGRPRQQRRARARRRPADDRHGQLAPDDAVERRGAVHLEQGGGSGNARRRRRLDRQRLLDRGDRCPPRPLLVRDLESGARRADPKHRDRLRPPRDPLQLGLARVDRQRAVSGNTSRTAPGSRRS